MKDFLVGVGISVVGSTVFKGRRRKYTRIDHLGKAVKRLERLADFAVVEADGQLHATAPGGTRVASSDHSRGSGASTRAPSIRFASHSA